MNDVVIWIAWFISIGIVYVTVLYLLHLRNKDEKRRINQLKIRQNLRTIIYDEKYRDVVKLGQELERLKRWGKRHAGKK